MAETYTLEAEIREDSKGSARDTRNAGLVPAIVYGHGVKSVSLSLNYSDILRMYRKAGQSSIIELKAGSESWNVLIHDLNVHPVRTRIHHVDFLAVNMNEKVVAHVPVKFTGNSPAVKNYGGIFMAEHETLDIRCLPADIPQELTIDISVLKEMHDHVTIADLNLDETKFEVMNFEPGVVLCSVAGRGGSSEKDDAEDDAAAAVVAEPAA